MTLLSPFDSGDQNSNMELSCGFFGTSFSLSSLFTESICNPVDTSFGSSVVVVSVSCVEDSPMIGKQYTVAKY